MRGGNRTNRKPLSAYEIEKLIADFKVKENPLYSPVTKKIYSNPRKWYCSITYNLDKNSCNYFFFLLEPPRFSEYSGRRLGIESFCYWRGSKKWAKYTKEELKKRVFMEKRRGTKCPKASNSLKEFYKNPNNSNYIKNIRIKQQKSRELFYTTEKGKELRKTIGKKISKSLQEKIIRGYTPKITNTWTHWTSRVTIEGITYAFRSSWECCFYVSNTHLEYESIRIPYLNNDKQKILIVDFFDKKNKTVFEIKPTSHFKAQQTKINAIINYCKANNLNFVWINENNILQYINPEKCTELCPDQYKKLIKHVKNN